MRSTGWSEGFAVAGGPKPQNLHWIGVGDQHNYYGLELWQYLQSHLVRFSKHMYFYVYLVLNFGATMLKLLKLSHFFCTNL